jgi:hypothetical protein
MHGIIAVFITAIGKCVSPEMDQALPAAGLYSAEKTDI